jgi:hypothetical protein
MKASPTADYPVRVYDEPSDQDPPEAELYEGIFTMVLNYYVRIAFIPDVSAVAPPWDDRLFAEADEITTVEQARMVVALATPYLVTPNEALAGTEETFESGHDRQDGPRRRVAFYVTPDEFARHADDLARLAALNAYSLHPKKKVSELRDYEVVGFVQRRVLASRWMDSWDASMLCLTPAGG